LGQLPRQFCLRHQRAEGAKPRILSQIDALFPLFRELGIAQTGTIVRICAVRPPTMYACTIRAHAGQSLRFFRHHSIDPLPWLLALMLLTSFLGNDCYGTFVLLNLTVA